MQGVAGNTEEFDMKKGWGGVILSLLLYYLQNLGYGLVSEIEYLKKLCQKPRWSLRGLEKLMWSWSLRELYRGDRKVRAVLRANLGKYQWLHRPVITRLHRWVKPWNLIIGLGIYWKEHHLARYRFYCKNAILWRIFRYMQRLNLLEITLHGVRRKGKPANGTRNTANKSKTESIYWSFMCIHYMEWRKMSQNDSGIWVLIRERERELHQAAFACSIECVVFYYRLNLNFEQVLSLVDVSVFEF